MKKSTKSFLGFLVGAAAGAVLYKYVKDKNCAQTEGDDVAVPDEELECNCEEGSDACECTCDKGETCQCDDEAATEENTEKNQTDEAEE
ncbi:MAG: hypothetical protein ACI39R_01925 [Lachnospiraceae bacterium]